MWKNFLAATIVVACGSVAQGSMFRVTFENLQAPGGFTLTPAWVGFHDGSFDLFDTGAAASAELEALAEVGDVGPLMAAFTGDQGVLAQPDGFAGAPVVEPGESASILIDATAGNDFFSYASMVIPSNDNFIGNGDAMAHAVPTTFGESITIDVAALYDAGTEVNDPDDGAAFSTTGGGGGTGTDEGGVVTLQDIAAFNATFGGTITPAGTVTEDLLTPIARFTVTAVPEPGSFGAFALAGLLLGFRRRRNCSLT